MTERIIMSEIKSQSFRLSKESTKKFRRFCEENGVSQAQGFDGLLRLAEIEKNNKEIAALNEKNRKLEQELAVFKKWDDIGENDNDDDSDFDVWEV